MSTRYFVEWQEGENTIQQGFAFGVGALELWHKLINAESNGGSDISGASIRYLGPNGERCPETSVSSTFSKVVGEAVGVKPPKSRLAVGLCASCGAGGLLLAVLNALRGCKVFRPIREKNVSPVA